MSSKLTELPGALSPQPTDLMYIVRPSLGVGGSLSITNDELFSTITKSIADKAVRYEESGTGAPISTPNAGAMQLFPVIGSPEGYEFQQSINGFPYRTIVGAADQNVGMNVGNTSTTPTFLRNGDLWYDSTTNRLMARVNGVNVSLGVPPGVPRALPPNTTVIGNVGADATILHDLQLPPGTLSSDGSYARVEMTGNVANNANEKTFNIGISGGGGGIPFGFPGVPINSGGFGNAAGWGAFLKIVRVNNTTALFTLSLIFAQSVFNVTQTNLTLGCIINSQTFEDTGFDFDTQVVGVNVNVTGVDDNDITQNLTTCELFIF